MEEDIYEKVINEVKKEGNTLLDEIKEGISKKIGDYFFTLKLKYGKEMYLDEPLSEQ